MIHSPVQCEGEFCPLHNPSDHHMADWPMTTRYDRFALVERICEHGCGHPDPDSLAWQRRMVEEGRFPKGGISDVHGCCGCCAP